MCFTLFLQVFLTHLHSDHLGDLPTFYVGAMFGRTKPWEIWGPSSETPELFLNAFIAVLRQVTFIVWHVRMQVPCMLREDAI